MVRGKRSGAGNSPPLPGGVGEGVFPMAVALTMSPAGMAVFRLWVTG